LEVGIYKKADGAPWVYVDLLKWARGGTAPRMIPSFRDLHRIIRAIAKCEDESYPPPAKGRTRLAEFLHDAVYEQDFQRLAVKYKIPDRDGDRIVNTNGAAVAVGDISRAVEPSHKTPFTAADVDSWK
jgi:hypothetical protein